MGAELHAVVLRVVDLRGEAPRRAVVASRRVDAGWQADVVLVVERGGFKLAAFSDSNWANNPDNGKSTSSYLTMLANAPLSSKSGLQGPTAMSTMEAELVASALAMKEAVLLNIDSYRLAMC